MNIEGKKKELPLSKEFILSTVSSYDIYRYYFGDFKMNHILANHLRGEKNASLIIGDKVGNTITHKDFGDYYWRGDCIDLVQQIFRCDFPTALKKIANDFGIAINDKVGKIEKSSVITWEQPKKTEHKAPPLFQIITRSPTREELKYWEQYGIGYEQLKKENIYFPKTIYRDKRKMFDAGILTFCYWYKEIEIWKIYRPLADKNEKSISRRKWDCGNIPFNYADHLHNINDCTYSFLTKSRKDRIVLQNCLETECITDVQAEDPSCISDDTISYLKENSKVQVTIFDIDKKGKESSWWLTNNHGFKHCNVPDKYLEQGITDFADMYKHIGEQSVKEHFSQKGFI